MAQDASSEDKTVTSRTKDPFLSITSKQAKPETTLSYTVSWIDRVATLIRCRRCMCVDTFQSYDNEKCN